MKINILYYLIVSLSLCFSVHSQQFGFIDSKGNPNLENIINNSLSESPVLIGKTYNVNQNNYNLSTSNDVVTLKLSCDTTIKLNNNTSLNFDSFDQFTIITPYPQQTQYNDFNCNLSLLNGEIEIINESVTNGLYINTELACIILGDGRFVIKSDGHSSTFIIIQGNATIMDNMGKKLYKVKDKDIITVTPRPILSGKAENSMKKQNIVTTSILDDMDDGVLVNEFNILNVAQHQYIFITIDGMNRFVKLRN